MPELVRTDADLPLGAVDASIAVAERLELTDVATLDWRHFTVVRPRHIVAPEPPSIEADRLDRLERDGCPVTLRHGTLMR